MVSDWDISSQFMFVLITCLLTFLSFLSQLFVDECQTALHLAVMTKQSRVARRLVAAGARVDMRDRQGNCPLHIAALNGDLDCVQALSMALAAHELEQCQLRYPPFAQTLPQQIDSSNYDGKLS